MTRLPRPYIPIDVRLKVAERQLGRTWSIPGQTKKQKLRLMLKLLFETEQPHLDHDPPLAAREKVKRGGIVIGYKPDANDPVFLFYRTSASHRLKTNVRGDGAQYPDRVLIKRARKLEQKKKKRKWRWPKRKMRS